MKQAVKLDSVTKKNFMNIGVEFKQAADNEQKVKYKKKAVDMIKRVATGQIGAMKFIEKIAKKQTTKFGKGGGGDDQSLSFINGNLIDLN